MYEELPTTTNDHLDASITGLTQIILYARKNVPPAMLARALRVTPVPDEPVTNCLYHMLVALSNHLTADCIRSEPNESDDAPLAS